LEGGTPLKSTAFEYHAPTTAAEAVGLLAELGDEAKLLAGGQSLIPMPARHQQLAHGVDPRQQPGRPGGGAASRASVALAVIADLASSSGHNQMRAHSS
jgi:FAD binding domain in molybdopterin dehydrogenase